MKDHKRGSAELLNNKKHHSVAAISFSFEILSWKEASCDVQISDCSRSINLDFSYEDEEEWQNAIDKAMRVRNKMDELMNVLAQYPPSRVKKIIEENKKLKENKNKIDNQ